MNFSDLNDKVLDHATVNCIGWLAVGVFAVCLTIFIYRLQKLLNIPV